MRTAFQSLTPEEQAAVRAYLKAHRWSDVDLDQWEAVASASACAELLQRSKETV